MKKFLIPLSVVAAASLSAQPVATVFSDDYEDETPGNPPTLGGSNVGDSYGTILNDLSVSGNPESNGNTSNQVLMGAGGTLSANNVPALFDGGAQWIDGMTVQYDFYSSSAGGNGNDGVRVALVGDADSNRDVFIRNDRDGQIRLDGTDLGDVNYGADTWQQFVGVFTALATPGEFDLAWRITNLETSDSISGNQTVVVDGSNFTDYRARGILLEVFEGNAGANSYTGYFDNVLVTAVVPEPSTIALGGLGLLSLLAARRRG